MFILVYSLDCAKTTVYPTTHDHIFFLKTTDIVAISTACRRTLRRLLVDIATLTRGTLRRLLVDKATPTRR